MKINKIISGVFSLLILSSFIGCTEIEDHPDGRTDYSDLFTTNRKTYTYMNQCYGWILNYGMNYNYTMLAGCTDEAKDSWELQNGVTRKWNEGQLSPFSNPLEGIEGNTCQTFNWNGREGENAHEKPEILEITGFHDCSHRHFLPPVRLHKAELGTDDKSLGFPLLHQ